MKVSRKVLITVVIAGVLLAALALALVLRKPKTIEVQSGTQVICTYGEIVSDDVETLVVPENEAGDYSVETSVVTCPLHQKLEDLYAQAQEDIAKGDLKGAREKLAEVVAGDPSNASAQDQLEDIDAGKKPTPSPGPGTGPPSTTPTLTPVGPVLNLVGYVPDQLAGYSAQAVIADVLSLSRVYLPKTSGDIGQLVIAADQQKDAAQATAKVAGVKSAYPSSPATVKVAGKDAYFGTNGRGFAVLATTDGAALVVFEMYSKSGKPANLKGALAEVAELVL